MQGSLKSWASKFSRGTRRRKPSRGLRKASRFAGVEQLEGRHMMAVVASFTNDQLSIIGDAANDTVAISTVDVGGVAQVTVNGQSVGAGVNASAVTSIFASLGGGTDSMNLSTLNLTKFSGLSDMSIEIRGGAGNDTLVGSPLGDILKGEDGNDSLTGGPGNDQLIGGNGNDTLVGGAGDDTLDGGLNDDVYSFSGSTDLGSDTVVQAASGNLDTLGFGSFGGAIVVDISMTTPQVVRAGLLTLTLSDGAGIDNVQGTAYDDVILGNAGGNSLMGNGGNDYLWGRGGNDWLDGGSGNDTLYGGDGDDTLLGKGGNDSLYGHAGEDTLNGNEGNDYLSGDEGDDTYIVTNYGTKTIGAAAASDSDRLNLAGNAPAAALDLLSTSVQAIAASLWVRFTSEGAVKWMPGAGNNGEHAGGLYEAGYYTVPGVEGTTTTLEFTYGDAIADYDNPVYFYDDATHPPPPVGAPQDPATYLFTGNVTAKGTIVTKQFPAGTKLGFYILQDGKDEMNGGPAGAATRFYAEDAKNTNDNDAGPHNHVHAYDLKPGVLQLSWEDLFYQRPNPKGYIQDTDFNDLWMGIEAVDYTTIDLDVDSDNTGPVDRSPDEEAIEASTTLPGKIIAVGGDREMMVVEWAEGTTATLSIASGADKVRVWSNAEDGWVILSAANPSTQMTTGVATGRGTVYVTYFIEAFAPSVAMADIAFTLVPEADSVGSALSDAVRATAGLLDLVVDGLAEAVENEYGAIVWRNSDFDRQLVALDQPEPGITRFLPDYTAASAIDPNYESQFTPATATFSVVAFAENSFRFTVQDPSSVLLWTTTEWEGFVAAGDGWWKIPSGFDVKPLGTTTGRIDFWIEGLASTTFAANSIDFSVLSKPFSGYLTFPEESSSAEEASPMLSDLAKLTVLDSGLGVDGNRDGEIDFADSFDRQLTFWLNNDREGTALVDPSSLFNNDRFETENASRIGEVDSADFKITATRDLEDFAALQLLVDPLLQESGPYLSSSPHFSRTQEATSYALSDRGLVRYELTLNSDNTYLRLFRAAGSAPDAHVKDREAANNQFYLDAEYRGGSVESSLIGDLVLKSTFTSDQLPLFLFEASGQAAAVTLTFTVVITYPDAGTSGEIHTTSRSHELELDLRDFTDFYTRMRIPYRTSEPDERYTISGESATEVPHLPPAEELFASKTAESPFLYGDDTFVLVHGWNMTDGTQNSGPNTDWKGAFAETAFKRLYWQGYRGSYSEFDWPTFADTEGPYEDWPMYPGADWDQAFLNATYNPSEYQAWRSGQSLMQYLASLRDGEGRVHLMAHSMGTVVAGEALRQWSVAGNSVPLVDTYIATQGAISAGAYGSDDTQANAGAPYTDLYRHWPTGDGDTEGEFYMNGSQGAAGRWVNFYNTVDAATTGSKVLSVNPFVGWDGRSAWPLSNWLKAPSDAFHADLASSAVWGYDYAWTETYGFERGNWEVVGMEDQFVSAANLSAGLLQPEAVGGRPQPGPTAYEVLAFLARSQSLPIGAQHMGGSMFAENFNLQSLGLTSEFAAEWPGHSFQYNFDAATTHRYWQKVLEVLEVDNGTYQ